MTTLHTHTPAAQIGRNEMSTEQRDSIAEIMYPASPAEFRDLWTQAGVHRPYAEFVRGLDDEQTAHLSSSLRTGWKLAPGMLRDIWTAAGVQL